MSGFQTRVNRELPFAVEGDFASANPRVAVVAGPGGFMAGEGGVTVAKFAWIDADGTRVFNHGTATQAPDGFVHRNNQALIQGYLQEASMNIPKGFPVTLFSEVDVWAKLSGDHAATRGAVIYADYSNGDVCAVAAPAGASVTGSIGSTNTASLGATFTASADTDTTRIVVTSVTGLISIGEFVSGTGITAGTTILSQVSGTPGGAGTYQLSAVNTTSSATVTSFGSVIKVTVTTGLISIGDNVSGGSGFPIAATVATQVSGTPGGIGIYTLSAPGTAYVASATGVTTFGNVVNVTAVASGVFDVGDAVSGSGVPSGAVIATQVSGTPGGIGIYTLSARATAYAVSTTITAVGGVLTTFKAKSSAAIGELVIISTWG